MIKIQKAPYKRVHYRLQKQQHSRVPRLKNYRRDTFEKLRALEEKRLNEKVAQISQNVQSDFFSQIAPYIDNANQRGRDAFNSLNRLEKNNNNPNQITWYS